MDIKEFNTATMKHKLHLTEHTILYEGVDDRDKLGDPFLLTIIYKHSGNQSTYIVQIEADAESWFEAREIYVAPAALEVLQKKHRLLPLY
jgi:hypothetical protein